MIVEDSDGAIVLSGMVESAEARQAAQDLTEEGSDGRRRVENDLDVETLLPASVADVAAGEPSAELAVSVTDAQPLAPDFTAQPLLDDPTAAAGPSGSAEDAVESVDQEYFAPTDPVVGTDARGRTRVLGGFSATSMDSLAVAASAGDRRLGDEALADAVARELHEDAATTALEIGVPGESRGGVSPRSRGRSRGRGYR